MEIPNIDNLPVMTCESCIKLQKTVKKDEFYCPIRMEFINKDRKACKRFDAKPKEEVKIEKKIKPKAEKTNEVKEVDGIYVYIPDSDFMGRFIGREGRNVREFQDCTGVTVDAIDSHWIWIGSENKENELIATHVIKTWIKMYKLNKDMLRLHPGFVRECVHTSKNLIQLAKISTEEKVADLWLFLNLKKEVENSQKED